jgi:hypothetical protein
MRSTDLSPSSTAKRAAKASQKKRRRSPAPSHEDRLATEAMAPRSVFVPRALIRKPGRQYEAPEKPPAKRGWGTQKVGPAAKPSRDGRKRTYTPYERALGRPLGIDIRHQTPTQIAGVTERGPTRAQRRRILRQQAQAAAQTRAHVGAARPLVPRADWRPRESDFGGDLGYVGRRVGGYLERTARDRYGEIIHPSAGRELHRARRGVEFATGIDPGDPLKHGPYWLAANAGLLAAPLIGRGVGVGARAGARALESATARKAITKLAEERGAVTLPVKGLSREHATALRTHRQALDELERAKATKSKKLIDDAKVKLSATKNEELYTRLRATSEAQPVPVEHPHFASRRALAQRLVRGYSKRAGALPPKMRSTPGIERTLSFLDDLASKGEHGRMWYEDSARAITEIARGDPDRAEKIAQLVAIYSPQQPILGNTSLAFRAYNDFLRDGVIRSGQTWQKTAAKKVLSGTGDWEGRKTNNFYVNFLEDLNPEKFRELGFKGDEVTSDLWMARAFGYKTDAVSEGRYDVIESAIRQLAAERGWKPKQVQAAIWTAIKDASDDVSANIDFASGIGRHLGQINYEAAIGATIDPELQALYASWPRPIQKAFLRGKAKLIDRFIDEAGLLSRPSEFGPGIYEGAVAPGARARIGTSAAPRIATAPGKTKVGYRVGEVERGLLNATSAAIGRALKQDTVAWMRPFTPRSKGVVNTLKVDLGRPATEEEALHLWHSLNEEAERFVVVHTDDGLFIRNISDVPNFTSGKADDFHDLANDAVDLVFPEKPPIRGYATDGELVESGSYEQAIESGFGDGGRSPEGLRFREASDRLSREAEALDKAFRADPARAAAEHPGPAEPRVARGRRVRRGVEPGLGSGPLFGWEGGGERGLIPEALSRLRREERGAVGPFGRRPEPVPEPVPEPGPVLGPKTLEESVAEGIQKAKPVRGRQEAGYTRERGLRIARAEEAYHAAGGGTEGHRAYRAAMRGELPKLNFSGMEHLSGADEVDALTRKIHASPELDRFQRGRAVDAVEKAVYGVVPTRSDIALLEKVFPSTEVEKVAATAASERSTWEKWSDLLQIPRTLQSSADVSALFRQALPVLTRHPLLWQDAIGPSFKAMRTDAHFDEFMKGLGADPAYAEAADAGVQFTDVGHQTFKGGAQVEEAYGSRLAEKLPVVGHSARQYTAFLDDLRLKMWKHLLEPTEKAALKQANRRGLDGQAALDKAHADLARYINSMTGRGPLPGKLRTASSALNAMFFSPRLLASRVDLLASPLSYARATPYVRRQALRSMAQLLGVGTGVLVAASHIPGVDVGLDPLSSDFGRIKIGDTRIDIWGGFQPIVKLLAQLQQGKYVSSTTGKEMPLSTDFGGSTRLSIIGKFLRQKFSPNASFIADWMDGQNVVGEQFKWSQQWRRVVPMLATDIVDTAQYGGPHAPAGLVGGLGALGFSSMTYGTRKKKGKSVPGFKPSQFEQGEFIPDNFVPSR